MFNVGPDPEYSDSLNIPIQWQHTLRCSAVLCITARTADKRIKDSLGSKRNAHL